MPEEHFQRVMDVNFFSVVKMCKRAIPLLQRQVLYERVRRADRGGKGCVDVEAWAVGLGDAFQPTGAATDPLTLSPTARHRASPPEGPARSRCTPVLSTSPALPACTTGRPAWRPIRPRNTRRRRSGIHIPQNPYLHTSVPVLTPPPPPPPPPHTHTHTQTPNPRQRLPPHRDGLWRH